MIYAKLFLLLILLFRSYQYFVGRFVGVSYHKLFIDFSYFGLCFYILLRFSPFTDFLVIDILTSLILIFFLIQLLMATSIYFKSHSFDLSPEKRLKFLVEKLIAKHHWKKGLNVLSAHPEVVMSSAILMFYLGEVHQSQNKYEQAFECFEEVCKISTEEQLVLLAAEKGLLLCCEQLKSVETGLLFIQTVQRRDLSQEFVEKTDLLIKKIPK